MRLPYLISTAALVFTPNVGAALAAAPPSIPKMIGGIEITTVHSDCHLAIRTHGGAYPPHSHRQSDCRVVYSGESGAGRDCHADVRRHHAPGYGNVWHRHSSSCSVIIYEEHDGPAPGVGNGCIKAGPVTICP